jgi:hypothetical protein
MNGDQGCGVSCPHIFAFWGSRVLGVLKYEVSDQGNPRIADPLAPGTSDASLVFGEGGRKKEAGQSRT